MKAVVQQTRVPRETEPEAAQAFAGAASGLARVMNEGPRAAAQQALRATLNPPVQRQVNSTGLPDALKSGVEELSGLSLDDVRVHYNATTPAPLQAAAFTRGSEIHLAPGQERHLAHEAWHVVQQKQGRVKSTGTVAGQPLNDDAALEHEADVMGGRALNGPVQRRALSSVARGAAVVQRVKKQVTGITHLVQARDDSVFEGDEVAELHDRDIVDIDENDVYLSRRGPNQEDFRETEDRDGPQHYEWFRVRTINGIAAAPDTYIREDTIEDVGEDALDVEPWLVFGTDGRSEQEIRDAVRIGYRRFDTAESYHTAHLLSAVLNDSDLDRSEYEIIYKFDVEPGETAEELDDWLVRVAGMFEGRIDTLIIHNAGGGDEAVATAWGVMDTLKREGIVREIGLGNVRTQHAGLVNALQEQSPIDVIENSISSILSDDGLRELVAGTDARVLYYDVMGLARAAGVNNEAGIRALIATMEQINPRSAAILSSSRSEGREQNFERYGTDAGVWSNQIMEIISGWKRRAAAPAEELPLAVRQKLLRVLQNHAVLARGFQEELLRRQDSKDSEATVLPTPTESEFTQWLTRGLELPREILAAVVPDRPGLLARYRGASVVEQLRLLMFGTSCYAIPAAEMISLTCHTLEEWNAGVRFQCTQIANQG